MVLAERFIPLCKHHTHTVFEAISGISRIGIRQGHEFGLPSGLPKCKSHNRGIYHENGNH